MKKPRLIIWVLTSKCNLACNHCYTARFIGRDELDEHQALRVVESGAEAGVKHIGFTGGEVFLRKDALSLIRYASQLGMSTSVVTNGLMLTEEVVRDLAKTGMWVFLSLDGARKETHERIRGGGTWESINSATQMMRNFGLRFSTVMAVSSLNWHEVSDYIFLAKGLGAQAACLIPVMPVGRASMEMVLKPREMMVVLQKVERTTEKLNFPISLWCVPFAPLVIKSKLVFADFCRTSSEEVNLDPNGNVLLCDVLDVVLSNIKEKEILEAWREQGANPLVKSLTTPKLAEPCLDCWLRNKCRGGCFARAQLMAGDIHAPDPLCPRVAGEL